LKFGSLSAFDAATRVDTGQYFDVDAVGQTELHLAALEMLRRGLDLDVSLAFLEFDDPSLIDRAWSRRSKMMSALAL